MKSCYKNIGVQNKNKPDKMRRSGKHRIKEERPETSASISNVQDRDLTYFIHDRVELMHQVFSVLKAKEIKAMVPHCVEHISLNDLQELCTEEVLGISSKRLCAILDGAEPPSDTETSSGSSSGRVETISLDSISSDEEILSQSSGKKKKHKHCRHKSKTRDKRKSSSSDGSDNAEKSTASRAGLTVLELLELQARARAIRAQLQQEQIRDVIENKAPESQHVSDDDVEIKEEPTEVVEISSDEEKPKIEELQKETTKPTKTATIINEPIKESHKITKKINDLIITVPQTKHTRKIKLNRTPAASKINTIQINNTSSKEKLQESIRIDMTIENTQKVTKEKQKRKIKKKGKDKKKEGSDHDEITLQLSDSEKMDLLENLDRKNYDSVSSSSTEDSESSSDSEEEKEHSLTEKTQITEIDDKTSESVLIEETDVGEVKNTNNEIIESITEVINVNEGNNSEGTSQNQIDKKPTNTISTEITNDTQNEVISLDEGKQNEVNKLEILDNTIKEIEDHIKKSTKDTEKSDGELSDRESSEIETSEVRPEVVCISDDEVNKKNHKKKKNKKKDKKSKKEKKTKNQDFRNGADQNFYTEVETIKTVDLIDVPNIPETTDQENCIDDVNDILELSDESSCNGEDGTTVLSKEPTAEEIEALSAKIDEIDRENIITDEEIIEHERIQTSKEVTEAEAISWKDRYLDSKKVKDVLTTANILNAIRKKNKDLKRKLEESKMDIEKEVEVPEKIETENLEEGSIEQYNTLEGSTKYVDPVKENEDLTNDSKVTKEMKKDAKQLLKMYKKLFKYNDMMREKDPNKKKKKKKKTKAEKDKTEANTEAKISS